MSGGGDPRGASGTVSSTEASQPQLQGHYRLDPSLWWARPVHCGSLSGILAYFPLDASSNPSCDYQKCRQTLPNVPWRKAARFTNTDFY